MRINGTHPRVYDGKHPGRYKMRAGSQILLTLRFSQEDSKYVGFCDDLGLASCGNTLEDAKSSLQEAIMLVLNRMTEMGEVQDYLEGRDVEVFQSAAPGRSTKTFDHISLKNNEWLTTTSVQVPAYA